MKQFRPRQVRRGCSALLVAGLVLMLLGNADGGMGIYVAGLLAAAVSVAMWLIAYRCPHCAKHLGRASGGAYCPHCGKELEK